MTHPDRRNAPSGVQTQKNTGLQAEVIAENWVQALNAHCGNDNAPIGTKKTGYSKAELGPFLCINCVHSNREGNRCNHPEVIADPETEKDDDNLVKIAPADCCNEFHPRG